MASEHHRLTEEHITALQSKVCQTFGVQNQTLWGGPEADATSFLLFRVEVASWPAQQTVLLGSDL